MVVEAGLEGIGEYPLDEGVVPLESFVVGMPGSQHLLDEFAVGPGGRLVEVEVNVYVNLLMWLRLERRRRLVFVGNGRRMGER